MIYCIAHIYHSRFLSYIHLRHLPHDRGMKDIVLINPSWVVHVVVYSCSLLRFLSVQPCVAKRLLLSSLSLQEKIGVTPHTKVSNQTLCSIGIELGEGIYHTTEGTPMEKLREEDFWVITLLRLFIVVNIYH